MTACTSKDLTASLRDGERPLYSGNPAPRWVLAPFFGGLIPIVGIPLFLETLIPADGIFNVIRWILYALYILILPVAALLMLSPLLLRRMQKNTVFAVTNQRILINKSYLFLKKSFSYEHAENPVESVVPNSDGSGSLFFRNGGSLENVPNLRELASVLTHAGVEMPSVSACSAAVAKGARTKLFFALTSFLVAGIIWTVMAQKLDYEAQLRSTGTPTTAEILEYKSERSGRHLLNYPLIRFTDSGKEVRAEIKNALGYDYRSYPPVGTLIDVVYNPDNLQEVIFAAPREEPLFGYMRKLCYAAWTYAVFALFSALRRFSFASKLKSSSRES